MSYRLSPSVSIENAVSGRTFEEWAKMDLDEQKASISENSTKRVHELGLESMDKYEFGKKY